MNFNKKPAHITAIITAALTAAQLTGCAGGNNFSEYSAPDFPNNETSETADLR